MKLTPKQAGKLINKWRKRLDIPDHWKISFAIRRTSNEMSSGNEDAEACITVSLSYLTAFIEFNESLIDERELDAIIAHEMLHIVVEPLSSLAYQGLGKRFSRAAEDATESLIERLVSVLKEKP